MALTPAEEAKYALDYGVSWSDLSLEAQIEYDRLADKGYGTAPLAVATAWLPNLGIAIRDGNVYRHGVDQSGIHSDMHAMNERAGRTEMKLLGPLAGARAEVLSAPTRRAFEVSVVVAFADGAVFDKKFDKRSTSASLLIRAQGEAARFNALAAVNQPGEGFTGEGEQDGRTDHVLGGDDRVENALQVGVSAGHHTPEHVAGAGDGVHLGDRG